MKLLDRYIAKQVFVSAIYAVVVIIIILVLGNVFKEILKELAKRPDLSLLFVLKFILLVIPISLSLAIPFSFLTAILLVFGRLSADSEFISMRMAGLSIWRICVPVWLLAIFFTGVCAFVNISVTPWAKTQMEGMKASLFNLMKKEPMMLFPDGQVMNDLPGHLVFARKEDDMLKGLQIIKMNGSMPETLVIAKEAKVSVDLDSKEAEMLLDMTDVNVMAKGNDGDFINSTQPIYMKKAPFSFSIDEFKELDQLILEKPGLISLGRLLQRVNDPQVDLRSRTIYKTELSTRFAFSISCITFSLIAVPLGITTQRRESSVGFILSMIIAVSYYMLLNAASMMFDRVEMHPHLLVWLPNLLFVALGFFLFWRLSKK